MSRSILKAAWISAAATAAILMASVVSARPGFCDPPSSATPAPHPKTQPGSRPAPPGRPAASRPVRLTDHDILRLGQRIRWAGKPAFSGSAVTLNGSTQYGYMAHDAALNLYSWGQEGASFWPAGLPKNHVQGAATEDGDTFFIVQIGPARIDKCTAAKVLASNLKPFAALPNSASLNHMGAPCIATYGGAPCIAVPVEKFAGKSSSALCIAFYKQSDLSLAGSFAVQATAGHGLTEISGCAVLDNILYVCSFEHPSRIFKFSFDGAYRGYITLGMPANCIQGITFDPDRREMYLSKDGADTPTSRVYSATGTYLRPLDQGAGPNAAWEGVCFCPAKRTVYLCQDGGAPNLLIRAYQADLASGGITVWAWIKPSTLYGERAIAARYAYDAKKRQWLLEQAGDHIQFRVGDGTTGYFADTPAKSLALDQWRFVMGTYDVQTNTIRCYASPVGGPVSASKPGAMANGAFWKAAKCSTTIGCIFAGDTPATAGQFFAGVISQIGVVNRVLTAAECNELLRAGPDR